MPPAVIGVLFLGDTTRPGLAPVAVIGFVIAVASAVMLARFGEAGQNSPGRPPPDPPNPSPNHPQNRKAGRPTSNPTTHPEQSQAAANGC
jgi:hypothetical protein